MNVVRHLPNALTSANLFCGCIGILFALGGELSNATYMVWLACVFDFFDGFAARMLKVSSPIGKELDSLADVVSFGVLPSMVMYALLVDASSVSWTPFVAFLIAVFSALRLARFNIDKNQSDSFIGLPTPANALFITALPFLNDRFEILISNELFLLAVTIIFSLLLVSPLPLFALKFKNFSWMDNRLRFTFLFLAVLLLLWQKEAAIPAIILLYIVLSFTEKRFSRS